MIRALLLFVLCLLNLESFDKVVIWGHKLHSHTHSYIHKGFYDAFSHLGYKTYWIDHTDDVEGIDFSNALFLTEGQVDQDIPLREDAIYVLHNCCSPKYKPFKKINIQVYTDDVLKHSGTEQVAPFIYYNFSGSTLYMPWATHLLPFQIDEVKEKLPKIQKRRQFIWVGTIGDGYFGNQTELAPFLLACKENGIPFVSAGVIGDEEHQKLISSSTLAPAIVGEWQKRVGYIPCRIFKNISYGQMGITNSRHVYELFRGKIVYHPDTYELFHEAVKKEQTATLEEQFALMDFVKNEHTYINRIHTIIDFLNRLGYIQ